MKQRERNLFQTCLGSTDMERVSPFTITCENIESVVREYWQTIFKAMGYDLGKYMDLFIHGLSEVGDKYGVSMYEWFYAYLMTINTEGNTHLNYVLYAMLEKSSFISFRRRVQTVLSIAIQCNAPIKVQEVSYRKNIRKSLYQVTRFLVAYQPAVRGKYARLLQNCASCLTVTKSACIVHSKDSFYTNTSVDVQVEKTDGVRNSLSNLIAYLLCLGKEAEYIDMSTVFSNFHKGKDGDDNSRVATLRAYSFCNLLNTYVKNSIENVRA